MLPLSYLSAQESHLVRLTLTPSSEALSEIDDLYCQLSSNELHDCFKFTPDRGMIEVPDEIYDWLENHPFENEHLLMTTWTEIVE
jgi:hypothetical protein